MRAVRCPRGKQLCRVRVRPQQAHVAHVQDGERGARRQRAPLHVLDPRVVVVLPNCLPLLPGPWPGSRPAGRVGRGAGQEDGEAGHLVGCPEILDVSEDGVDRLRVREAGRWGVAVVVHAGLGGALQREATDGQRNMKGWRGSVRGSWEHSSVGDSEGEGVATVYMPGQEGGEGGCRGDGLEKGQGRWADGGAWGPVVGLGLETNTRAGD